MVVDRTERDVFVNQRGGAIAGIAYVVLFVVGFFLFDTPEGDASDAKWVDYYSDSGNRVKLIVAMYLIILSALGFMYLAANVRRRIRESAPERETLAALAFGSGVAHAVILMLAVFAGTVVAGGVEFVDAPVPEDADLLRALDGMFFGAVVIPGLLTAALFALASALGLRRAEVVPGWIVVAGFVVAVTSLFGALFFPIFLWEIWVLILSIALLVRSGRVRFTGAR